MPSYKLVYFDLRGLAEPIRMSFAHAGQAFEDVRYSQEEWPKHKPEAPMQQLPYLEVDGKRIPQSRAILGFVGREFGLYGASNEETTTIEVVIASVFDLIQPFGRILFAEQDETKKKEQLEEFFANKAPIFLGALENILKHNKGGDGFFVGSKISTADIFFHCMTEKLSKIDDHLKKYPKLFALRERIGQDPNIAAHLANRPETKY